MKRFQFSLNTVLSYKQQVLEELQNEHGQLLYQVRQQELVLQAAEERAAGPFERQESSKNNSPTPCLWL